MPDLGELRRTLAAVMAERGDWPARSPWIRGAVDATPRDQFAPDRLWFWDGYDYMPVDRTTDPDAWGLEVYGNPDTASVTQVTGGVPSSSLSCQAVVVDMLDALDLEPGHHVLELGTGTGWNAALLAHRAAPSRVVSVEVDESLADAARARLAAVQARVDVRVADGSRGLPDKVPYDRVISTYAVDQVPWAWIQQCRPGGRIVTPWGRLGSATLTVADDGKSATGPLEGRARFMPARGTGPASIDYPTARGTGPADHQQPITRDLTPLRDNIDLQFALRVAIPDLAITTAVDEDGINAWIHDSHESWAALSAEPDGATTAHEGGPRRLALELEHAWDQWLYLGSPAPWDYGMTVTPDRQYVWCYDPHEGPRWATQPIDKPVGLPLAG